ncbi:MAG: bpr, partial [Arthrobacter sp.]|nr:bpr [Arthrobacter sp.]
MRSERRAQLFAVSAMLLVGVAPLVTSQVWAQQAPARLFGQPGRSRLNGDLRQLVARLGPRPQAAPGGTELRLGLAPQAMQFDSQGRVGVSVTAANPTRLVRALTNLGMRVQAADADHHVIEGFAPVSALTAIEGLGPQGLLGVTALPRAILDTGSVNSQAVFVHEADRVHATTPPGVTGAGVRVGIISDSYGRIPGGAAAGVTSGDLPAGGVNVLLEGPSNGIDEGRAMAELIHDVAPGAALVFSSGTIGGPAGRAQSVRNLADPAQGNCSIIADDIFYMTEPFFQDGLTAQAVEEVVSTRGAGYFCSAG